MDAAKAAEGERDAREYLVRHVFPEVRASLTNSMQRCLSAPAASTADFTIVADIAADGSLASVAVRPATNTARCFAEPFGTLRLARPPNAYSSGLPIVVEMELGGSNAVR